MVQHTNASDMGTEPMEDLVTNAEELIGTDALWRGQILYAGASLGIFDALDADPTPASILASNLDLDSDRTYRLLRAMAHFGVLEEDNQRRFSLTPVGELFQRDHPNSVRSDLLFNRSNEWLRSMLHLPRLVEDGGPPGFEREFGTGFFDYTASNPDFAGVYNELMELASRDHPDQFLDTLAGYDFSRFDRLCDVGGGRGYFLCHLLDAIPQTEGVVFDLPNVIDEAERTWSSALGVSHRCSYRAGNMFEEIPESDVHFLKWILHNWGGEECQQILSGVRESTHADGRLFIIETIVPEPGTPHFAKRLDITMMTQVGGRERTQEEYRTLLNRSGWSLKETWRPDEAGIDILEAEPA